MSFSEMDNPPHAILGRFVVARSDSKEPISPGLTNFCPLVTRFNLSSRESVADIVEQR